MKSGMHRLLGLLMAIVILPLLPVLVGSAQDSPPAGFDLRNQHSTTEAGITTQNVGQLGLAWSIPTKENVSHWPLVDPATNRLYFADWGGTVYATDATTGQVLWQKQVEQPMTQWPWYGFAGTGTLGEGMLFEASVEGNAFALDVQTGEVQWQTEFTDDPEAGNVGKLLYHDGLVYIGVQSVEEALDGMMPDFTPNFRGKVVALNAQSGEVAWERSLVEAPHNGVAVWSSFALDPETNTLFFTTGNNYTGEATELSDAIIAVDAKTGEIRWASQTTEHDVWTKGRPIGPDYDFGAGPQLFEATIDGQERHLVGAGQKSGIFWAFDRETGEIVWLTTVGYGGAAGGIHAEAAIGQDAVYVWSNNSYTYGMPPEQVPLTIKALDKGTGRNLWVIPKAQPAAVPSAGFLANDVYFVGSLDGVVRGYRAADGQQVWTSQQHGAIGTALVAVGYRLFFGTGVPKRFGGGPATNGMFAYALGAASATPAGTPMPGQTPIVVETTEAGEMVPNVGLGTPIVGEVPAGTPAAAGSPVGASSAMTTVETVSFAFQPAQFTIPAGSDVQVTVTNPSDVEHTFTIEELGINVEVHPGETKTVTINAQPGEYTYICKYHPDRMTGTLIVQ